MFGLALDRGAHCRFRGTTGATHLVKRGIVGGITCTLTDRRLPKATSIFMNSPLSYTGFGITALTRL